MPLNLQKVNIDKTSEYLDLITKKKTRELTVGDTQELIEDIENEIGEQVNDINNNGRSLLLYPIEPRSKFSSALYNMIINGIDDDVRFLSVSIVKITGVLNALIDTINRYHKGMMSNFNENITEIKNIGKLSESIFEFNDFISDSFTSETNEYQFRDSATNTEDTGLYKMATFSDDTLVDSEDDAYYNIQVLNDDLTILYENGSIFEKNIDEAYNIITYAENPTTFIGTIAGDSVVYNGMLIAVIINMPAKRLVDHISFAQFASSSYDIFEIYYANSDTSDYKSSNWQKLEGYYSDIAHRGAFEFNINRTNFQSLMFILSQPIFKNKRVDINPDRLARLVHNIEDDSYSKLINIKKMYHESLLFSGMDVIRKDDVKYKSPSLFANMTRKLVRFMSNIMRILKPEKFITHKNGFLYDIGLHRLMLKYKEYRTFSIFESNVFRREGNILSCQLAKSDKTSDSVYVKYFILFESLKKRILGVKDKETTDIFVVNSSSETVIDLDFYARPHTNDTPIELFINGKTIPASKYEILYGDINEQVVEAIQVEDSLIRFGNIVKINYSVSPLDINYNIYQPSLIYFTNEVGVPNIRERLLVDPNESDTVVVKNRVEGLYVSEFVPAELGTTVRRAIINQPSGEEPEIGWFIKEDFAQSKGVNPDLYTHDEFTLGQPSGQPPYKLFKSADSVQTSVPNIYMGILNEEVSAVSGEKDNEFNTTYPYVPGSVVTRIENKSFHSQEYKENDTDLTKVELKTKTVLPNERVYVSYLPLHDTVLADAASSNLSEHNKTDVKTGTDALNAVTLNSFPFIDFNIINNSGPGNDWIELDNQYSYRRFVSVIYSPIYVTIGGVRAMDKSEYTTENKPTLDTFIDEKRNYQFYTRGNQLFFNTAITDNITIRYYTLGSAIKLRAELFRNNLAVQSITPEMYDYTMMLNII